MGGKRKAKRIGKGVQQRTEEEEEAAVTARRRPSKKQVREATVAQLQAAIEALPTAQRQRLGARFQSATGDLQQAGLVRGRPSTRLGTMLQRVAFQPPPSALEYGAGLPDMPLPGDKEKSDASDRDGEEDATAINAPGSDAEEDGDGDFFADAAAAAAVTAATDNGALGARQDRIPGAAVAQGGNQLGAAACAVEANGAARFTGGGLIVPISSSDDSSDEEHEEAVLKRARRTTTDQGKLPHDKLPAGTMVGRAVAANHDRSRREGTPPGGSQERRGVHVTSGEAAKLRATSSNAAKAIRKKPLKLAAVAEIPPPVAASPTDTEEEFEESEGEDGSPEAPASRDSAGKRRKKIRRQPKSKRREKKREAAQQVQQQKSLPAPEESQDGADAQAPLPQVNIRETRHADSAVAAAVQAADEAVLGVVTEADHVPSQQYNAERRKVASSSAPPTAPRSHERKPRPPTPADESRLPTRNSAKKRKEACSSAQPTAAPKSQKGEPQLPTPADESRLPTRNSANERKEVSSSAQPRAAPRSHKGKPRPPTPADESRLLTRNRAKLRKEASASEQQTGAPKRHKGKLRPPTPADKSRPSTRSRGK